MSGFSEKYADTCVSMTVVDSATFHVVNKARAAGLTYEVK
jgi:hypothetical protein